MAKGNAVFRAKAPVIMDRLMADFPQWDENDAAADLGNLGQECGGFMLLQEQKPTVAGSKGGYGWYQWTGPRRRAYFAWCKKSGLDVNSDDANYGFHRFELQGEFKAVISQVAAAKTLADKVNAFERGYERAGTPNYPSRQQWAQIAIDAWLNAHKAKQAGKPASAQTPPPQSSDSGQTAKPARAAPPVAQNNNLPPAPATKKKAPWFAGILAALGIGGAGGAAGWHYGELILFGGGALVLVVFVAVWLHGRKAS